MYNWETFQTAYQAASAEQKAIVDADIIPLCVRGVVISNQLDEPHYKKLVKLYALFVLNALSEQQILEEMRTAGIPDSKRVFDTISVCQNNRQATPPVDEDLSADIAEVEAVLETTPHIRTMSDDMVEAQTPKETNVETGEVTYSSTQNSLLNERKKEVPSDTPRWESD